MNWGARSGRILEEVIISRPVNFDLGDVKTLELSGAVERVTWEAIGVQESTCLECSPAPDFAPVDKTSKKGRKITIKGGIERVNTAVRNVIKGWSSKQ